MIIPQSLTVTEASEFEGIRVTVRDGSDVYNFSAGFVEVEEDLGGFAPVVLRDSVDSAIYKNGEYYLPWHVGSLLGNNGEYDSWIESATASEAIEVLQDLKQEYMESFGQLLSRVNEYSGSWT